jgi:hypothetical protein
MHPLVGTDPDRLLEVDRTIERGHSARWWPLIAAAPGLKIGPCLGANCGYKWPRWRGDVAVRRLGSAVCRRPARH